MGRSKKTSLDADRDGVYLWLHHKDVVVDLGEDASAYIGESGTIGIREKDHQRALARRDDSLPYKEARLYDEHLFMVFADTGHFSGLPKTLVLVLRRVLELAGIAIFVPDTRVGNWVWNNAQCKRYIKACLNGTGFPIESDLKSLNSAMPISQSLGVVWSRKDVEILVETLEHALDGNIPWKERWNTAFQRLGGRFSMSSVKRKAFAVGLTVVQPSSIPSGSPAAKLRAIVRDTFASSEILTYGQLARLVVKEVKELLNIELTINAVLSEFSNISRSEGVPEVRRLYKGQDIARMNRNRDEQTNGTVTFDMWHKSEYEALLDLAQSIPPTEYSTAAAFIELAQVLLQRHEPNSIAAYLLARLKDVESGKPDPPDPAHFPGLKQEKVAVKHQPKGPNLKSRLITALEFCISVCNNPGGWDLRADGNTVVRRIAPEENEIIWETLLDTIVHPSKYQQTGPAPGTGNGGYKWAYKKVVAAAQTRIKSEHPGFTDLPDMTVESSLRRIVTAPSQAQFHIVCGSGSFYQEVQDLFRHEWKKAKDNGVSKDDGVNYLKQLQIDLPERHVESVPSRGKRSQKDTGTTKDRRGKKKARHMVGK